MIYGIFKKGMPELHNDAKHYRKGFPSSTAANKEKKCCKEIKISIKKMIFKNFDSKVD